MFIGTQCSSVLWWASMLHCHAVTVRLSVLRASEDLLSDTTCPDYRYAMN